MEAMAMNAATHKHHPVDEQGGDRYEGCNTKTSYTASLTIEARL